MCVCVCVCACLLVVVEEGELSNIKREGNYPKLKKTWAFILRLTNCPELHKRPPQRYTVMKFYRVPRIKGTKNLYKEVFQSSKGKKISYVQQKSGVFKDIHRHAKIQKTHSSSTLSLSDYRIYASNTGKYTKKGDRGSKKQSI